MDKKQYRVHSYSHMLPKAPQLEVWRVPVPLLVRLPFCLRINEGKTILLLYFWKATCTRHTFINLFFCLLPHYQPLSIFCNLDLTSYLYHYELYHPNNFLENQVFLKDPDDIYEILKHVGESQKTEETATYCYYWRECLHIFIITCLRKTV